MTLKKLADNMDFLMGALASALLLGALGIQYIGRYAPCELCILQRWPLLGAAIVGLIGGFAVRGQSSIVRQTIVTATILLVALSGAIAVYHAGGEWKFWQLPQACTGPRFVLGAPADSNAYKIVECGKPAMILWPGLSLAGYNALISLGSAILAALIVRKAKKA